MIHMKLLSLSERLSLLAHELERQSFMPDDEVLTALKMSQLAHSPLFINLVVSELKQLRDDQVSYWVARYSKCHTLVDLCDAMIDRWEFDYDDNNGEEGMVVKALSLISFNSTPLQEYDAIDVPRTIYYGLHSYGCRNMM